MSMLLLLPTGLLIVGAYFCAQKARIEYEYEDYAAAGCLAALSTFSVLAAGICVFGVFAFHV